MTEIDWITEAIDRARTEHPASMIDQLSFRLGVSACMERELEKMRVKLVSHYDALVPEEAKP